MAAFAPANAALAAAEGSRAVRAPTPTPPTTPTTPTPATRTAQPPRDGSHDASSSPGTPTRHSFGGLLGQRPLPAGPPTAPAALPAPPAPPAVRRDGSHRSQKAEDVEMGEAGHDDEPDADDDGDSDNESAKSESQRSGSKKKKGQRFFCTDFPPCQLSFTRSEHLARHIRKHTGERPFQCHCSRRFSRLDNLRQHAQTVHVNEEIPAESLAATSTRFQRQIRTDRVRPPNNRSRASTLGSNGGGAAGGGGGGGGGGHSRGHSRNLSASSVGSAVSSMGGMPDDARRRPPPPLAMANDPAARARLSLENYGAVTGSPGPQYMYYNSSPAGYSTRTSTAYSTGGQHSPRFQSGVVSPVSTISRSSFYNGSRASGRRLSVPSGANPFQQQNSTYALPYFSPLPSGQSATFSQSGSIHGSPTSSMYSHGRRESESEMEYRRRTWHPTTNSQYQQRPATSGLTYHQTPDEPRPAFIQQQAASQMTRLPGIESFDHAPPPSSTRQPDPVMIESSPRPTSSGRELQQGLTRLDIAAANAPVEGQWQVQQVPPPQPAGYYPQAPPHPYVHPKHMSMPEGPVTPRKYKRNAWYGGPVNPRECGGSGGMYMPHRPSPEDSGSSDGVPTPSTSQGAEYNPVIVNPGMPAEHHYSPGTAITTDEQKAYCDPNQSNHVQHKEDRMRTDSGYHSYVQQPPQQQAQPPQTYALQNGHDPRFAQADYGQPPNNDMAKLEALVAVATSEGHRAEHRS